MANIQKVEKMLLALLKSEGLVEWIGGYVYGRTSKDDPYIILYPAAEHLKEKVCRVYEHQFKKLPAFIVTDHIPADTDGNPDKEKAKKRGIYHECPAAFQIVMHLGRDTQMGREKRFSDVLYVSQRQPAQQAPAAGQAVQDPPPRPATEEEAAWAHWYNEAATASDPLMFDTAIAKLEPWFQDSGNVEKFRGRLFGEWDATRAQTMTGALLEYAKQRKSINGSMPRADAHEKAKVAALAFYEES